MDVCVALHDGVVKGFVDTRRVHMKEIGLEECLREAETLIADGDHLATRKLVALFEAGTGRSGLHLLLKVQCHVAQLLLDVSDNLTVSMKSCTSSGAGGIAV